MKKHLLIFSLTIFLFSCKEESNIVEPELIANETWSEILKVDSTGRENNNGSFTVENVLELFDSTYMYTSNTIGLETGTTDIFFLHHEGKFIFSNDELRLYTFDKKNINTLKTELINDTLWVGGIERCGMDDNGSSYSCVGVRDDLIFPLYMSSFLWEKFGYKNTATFIKK